MQDYQGAGDDDVIRAIAQGFEDAGLGSGLADILKTISKWRVTNHLQLEFGSESDLKMLEKSFENHAAVAAVAMAFKQHLGVQVESVQARLSSKESTADDLHPSIAADLETILNKKTKPSTTWIQLDFGKHSGKTIPEIMFHDPQYFFWAWDQARFESSDELYDQAQDIYHKSRRIHVPQTSTEKLVVEVFIHPFSKDFSHFELVPESRVHHEGASPTMRLDSLNMALVQELNPRDRIGYEQLLTDMRSYQFVSNTIPTPKAEAEAFFVDEENFD